MNAAQRRKAYRRLVRLKRERIPVITPPVYTWGRTGREPKVITFIESVQRHNGMAFLPDSSRPKWPRSVANHNITPVPRCWRGSYHAQL